MTTTADSYGAIKAINTQRGFGFITPHDKSADLFFHISEFDRSVAFTEELIGRRVRFTPAESDRGLRATKISLAT